MFKNAFPDNGRVLADSTAGHNCFGSSENCQICANVFTNAVTEQIDSQIYPFYKEKIEAVQNTIQVLYPETGDVAALAVHGGDLMWRVGAGLALGRCRYTSPRAGGQLGATKLIDQLMNDPEPRIKLAASVAKSLTREGIHKIR